MNLTSLSYVRCLLKEIGVVPNRRLGQNFLIDKNILDIIIAAADLSTEDRVLEVGPGLGVLTQQLLAGAGHVVGVEKDRSLSGYLGERFAGDDRFELIPGDALDIDIDSLGINKVVSNLPYSVGSRFLVEMSMADNVPCLAVVTLQNEVAGRIVASHGDKEYGLLSVWLGLDYDAKKLKTVSRTCFWPRPEISSAVVLLKKRDNTFLDKCDRDFFYKLTKQAFSQRRKQMITILVNAPESMCFSRERAMIVFAGVGLSGKERPGDLSVAKWCELSRALGSD